MRLWLFGLTLCMYVPKLSHLDTVYANIACDPGLSVLQVQWNLDDSVLNGSIEICPKWRSCIAIPLPTPLVSSTGYFCLKNYPETLYFVAPNMYVLM